MITHGVTHLQFIQSHTMQLIKLRTKLKNSSDDQKELKEEIAALDKRLLRARNDLNGRPNQPYVIKQYG